MLGLRDVDSQRWRLRMPCLPIALDLWRAGCAISCRMCVLRLRLVGDLVFDVLCSCLVCIVRVFVGEQRRARRELRIQMDEGFWAGGICLLSVGVSHAGVCQVHEEVGSSSNSGGNNNNNNHNSRFDL